MASENVEPLDLEMPVFQSSRNVLGREVRLCIRLHDINKELIKCQDDYEERLQRVSCRECKAKVSNDWWQRNKARYDRLWRAHLECIFELKTHLFVN